MLCVFALFDCQQGRVDLAQAKYILLFFIVTAFYSIFLKYLDYMRIPS